MLRIFAVLLALAGSAAAAEVTVLTAKRIHTMDPSLPSATALAWDESGRLLAVGERTALLDRYPGAHRIEAGGATVVPGLIDAHGHVMSQGLALLRADLVGAATKEEAIARLRAFERTLPAGAWLLGPGWDQNGCPGKQSPTP